MPFVIEGATTGNRVEVDSNKHLLVNTPTDVDKAGTIIAFFEKDPGTITGTRNSLSPEVSGDYRLRVGADTLLDFVTFNFADQATGFLQCFDTVMVMDFDPTNGMVMNSTGVTANNAGLLCKTYRHFPLFGASDTYCETNVAFSLSSLPANVVMEVGLSHTIEAYPYTFTDGVFFRASVQGLQGVLCFNGSETLTTVFVDDHGDPWVPVAERNYKFTITINERLLIFWVNDTMYGQIETPTGFGRPMLSRGAPWAMRQVHVNGAAGAAMKFRVTGFTNSLADWQTSKPWAEQLAGAGYFCQQAPQGWPQGGTAAGLGYNTVPSAFTPSPTALNGHSGLGGLYVVNTSGLAVGNDYLVMGWQNPRVIAGGGSACTARTFYMHGIRIAATVNSASPPSTMAWNWILGIGGTSCTMSATEGAATKAFRNVNIGNQYIGALASIGEPVSPVIDCKFTTPLVVHPGEWAVAAIRFRNYASVVGLSLWADIAPDGYFE